MGELRNEAVAIEGGKHPAIPGFTPSPIVKSLPCADRVSFWIRANESTPYCLCSDRARTLKAIQTQRQAEARRRVNRQRRTIGMGSVSSMTGVQDIEIQAQSPQPCR